MQSHTQPIERSSISAKHCSNSTRTLRNSTINNIEYIVSVFFNDSMPFAIKIQRWHVTFPQWYALIRKSSATVCHFIAYYFNSNTDPCDVRPHPLLIELSDSLPSKSWRGKMIRLLAEYIFVDVRPFLGHAATQPLQLYIVCCLEFKDRRYSRFYAHYRAYGLPNGSAYL